MYIYKYYYLILIGIKYILLVSFWCFPVDLKSLLDSMGDQDGLLLRLSRPEVLV